MSRVPPTPEQQDAASQPFVPPKLITYNPMRVGVSVDGGDVTITALIPGEMLNLNVTVEAFEAMIEKFNAEKSGIALPPKPSLVLPS